MISVFSRPPFFLCVSSRQAVTPPLRMEELIRQLTEVSLRQHQIVEHLATRQSQADQEITALRTAARQRVPLPDPRVQATQLLPKMSAHDDVEAYLQMFENRQDGDPRTTGRIHANRALFSQTSGLAGRLWNAPGAT